MRVLAVLSILLLAGCAGTSSPTPTADMTQPIHGSLIGETVQQFGPDNNETSDAKVLIAICGGRDNVFAYEWNATQGREVPAAVTLYASKGTPNATSYLLGAFLPSAGGLEVASYHRGGTGATIDPWHEGRLIEWKPNMPEMVSLPVDTDGIARIVVACQGEGVVNYIIGTEEPTKPDYLDPVVGKQFDVFLAAASDQLTIPLVPPPTAAMPAIWSTAGGVTTTFDVSPVFMTKTGSLSIEWSGGAGWTQARCESQGWADDGEWSYEGAFHGDTRTAGGPMVDHIATLGLSQAFVGGYIRTEQTAGGMDAASLEFRLDHVASLDFQWDALCEGIHIGTPLTELFGEGAASEWVGPDGFL